MELTINQTKYKYDKAISLSEVAKKVKAKDYLAATVNGRLRELSFIMTKDAEIEFLGFTNPDAIRIYESTLRYVIAMAVKNLYPEAKLRFNYSISRSILAVMDEFKGVMDKETVEKIKNEVNKITNTVKSFQK